MDPMFDPLASTQARAALVQRWNNTWVPQPNSGKSIDIYSWQVKLWAQIQYQQIAKGAGYSSLFDAMLSTYDEIVLKYFVGKSAASSQDDAICARVEIRVEQNLVQERQAFKVKPSRQGIRAGVFALFGPGLGVGGVRECESPPDPSYPAPDLAG